MFGKAWRKLGKFSGCFSGPMWWLEMKFSGGPVVTYTISSRRSRCGEKGKRYYVDHYRVTWHTKWVGVSGSIAEDLRSLKKAKAAAWDFHANQIADALRKFTIPQEQETTDHGSEVSNTTGQGSPAGGNFPASQD